MTLNVLFVLLLVRTAWAPAHAGIAAATACSALFEFRRPAVGLAAIGCVSAALAVGARCSLQVVGASIVMTRRSAHRLSTLRRLAAHEPLTRIAALLTLVCGGAPYILRPATSFGLRVSELRMRPGRREDRMRLYRKLASLATGNQPEPAP